MEESLAFGRFELHRATRQLLKDGAPVDLGGRAFDVLCALIDGRDRVISKVELFERAWPGRIVEDNNLAVQISSLRKLLGAAAVATIASRGYRFVLPVRSLKEKAVGSVHVFESAFARQCNHTLHPTVVMAALFTTDANHDGDLDTAASAALCNWIDTAGGPTIRHHGGSALTSRGALWIVRFTTGRDAAACAMTLHDRMRAMPWCRNGNLRIGLSAGDAVRMAHAVDSEDAGADCADAVQLAQLADAGETHASASVRDRIADDVDCRIDDRGVLNAYSGLVALRVYALSNRTGGHRQSRAGDDFAALKPLIAVIPFDSRDEAPQTVAIGEMIADGLIERLSNSRHAWRIISRLSTAAFRGRTHLASEAQFCLGADFVVGGGFVLVNDRLQVMLQIVDCRTGEVVGSRRADGAVSDLLCSSGELLQALLESVQQSVCGLALTKLRYLPLPTLQSYTLLLGGIQLLHSSEAHDFDFSFRVMEQLVHWHPQALEPRVWQAKWYALRAVQGLCVDPLTDARAALTCTGAVLERDPNHAFALAMEGFVHVHLTRDYSAASERLEDALLQNDSETFAHLFKAVVQGLNGNFKGGLSSYRVALSTSPYDPARYLMDTIGAYLFLGCGQYEEAINVATQSLRRNRNHAHTWRTIAIAQQESGAVDDAQRSVKRILALQPGLTVKRYLADAKPGDVVRERFAQALGRAGLPSR